MNTNGPPDCHQCGQPIVRGMEVQLNKKPFHPGCAVVVAKERKYGCKADDARRSEEGDEAGIIACANPAGN